MTFEPVTAEPGTPPSEPVAAEPLTAEPVTPELVVSAPARRRSPGILNIALGVALAIAISGVAFAVGRSTAPAGTTGRGANGNFPAANGNFPGGPLASGGPGGGLGGAGRGGLGGGLSIEGTVVSVDGSSITIKTAAGTTVVVSVDTDTAYHRQAEATASDVAPGNDVIVRLDGAARLGRGNASPSGPIGTAGDVTVVP